MHPIGIFDSGYGGLTVFRAIQEKLPEYDFIYLGDNARAPYGTRSFETVYQYTLESVRWFFERQCPLVILACNTASAKALRTIQQHDLSPREPNRRVLGVIRPTAEIIGSFTKSRKVGILGTPGTVASGSYPLEIAHFYPDIDVFQHACPLWVPFVENGHYQDDDIDEFIRKDLDRLFAQSRDIDTLLLACTHYPLLAKKIKKFVSPDVQLISQGPIVADRLKDYLDRHPEIDGRLSKGSRQLFFTTDRAGDFEKHGSVFLGRSFHADTVSLSSR